MLYFYYLNGLDKEDKNKLLLYLFLIIFWSIWFFQLMLNFIRISSQWWWWPFVYYKQNFWFTDEITDKFEYNNKKQSFYKASNVFDLQFPHYKKFLNVSNNRKNWEWVYLAWTYAQYFIEDQTNLVYDQFITWLWKNLSDNDPCKTYLRLKDKKIKYIAIDPNIWTVVMWWWNMTLFDRFFTKQDPATWKIQDDWALSMMAKLYKNWFVKYFSSNNLWAKYAFILSDEDMRKYFWQNLTDEELTLARAKLSIVRFWQNSEDFMKAIMAVFISRIQSWDLISDLADLQGRIVDTDKLIKLVNSQKLAQEISKLNNDEKIVLYMYLQLSMLYAKDKQTFEKETMRIINQSINSSSQIIVWEIL